MTNIPLHFRIAERLVSLMNRGKMRKSKIDIVAENQFMTVSSKDERFSTNQETFICAADIYDGLSKMEKDLVMQIQAELKMNNPLWYCPGKGENSRLRGSLAALKRKEIVDAISGTDLYIVNPEKIRKGRLIAVYSAFFNLTQKKYLKDPNFKLTKADIRRLTEPDSTRIPVAAGIVG